MMRHFSSHLAVPSSALPMRPIHSPIHCTNAQTQVSDPDLPFDGSHGSVDGLKCELGSAVGMVSSDAATIEEYLATLPEDRRIDFRVRYGVVRRVL